MHIPIPFKKFFICSVSLMLLTSCARDISSDHYVARQVGEVSSTYSGVIRDARYIAVGEHDQLDQNGMGMTFGGVAGGVVGNAIGHHHLLPTAFGAVAGAVAGSLAEKEMKRQTGIEYIIELEQGGMMSIVQGKDYPLGVGQPVYVIVSPTGRSRVIAQ